MADEVHWTDLTQALSSAGGTLLLLVALGMGYCELQELDRARTATTVTEIQEKWDSEDFRQSRELVDEWMNATPPDSIHSMSEEAQVSMERVVNYFERVGYLVDKGVIDRDDADALISPLVAQYWCIYKPYILRIREIQNLPTVGEWFQRYAEASMETSPQPC